MPEHALFSIPVHDPIQIFLILVLCALFLPALARLFRIPDIMILMLAGVALGPYLLGVLEQDRVLDLFSSVGILFLMFLAGLEIDEHEFIRHRNASLAFGAITFAVPMAIGTVAGLFVLGIGPAPSILLASLFASHTLLAYPLASRRGLAGDKAVATAVGGTAITDVAALLVLAVIVALDKGEFGPGVAIKMGLSLAIFVAFELVLLPRAVRWALNRLKRDEYAAFLFSLAVLFISALLSELAGVEPIIGAFLAGLALGRSVPHVSPLANRLEFLGNALFVPAFLLSVGMLVDPLAFVRDGKAILTGAVMTLCVTAAKFLAAQTTRLLLRWDGTRAILLFGLSLPQAAATLAAVLVGFRAGILGTDVLNGTIIMIFVTVAIGSLATDRASKALASQSAPAESDPHRTLLGLSLTRPEGAEELVEAAHLMGRKSGVKALCVLPPGGTDQSSVAAAERLLERASKRAAAAGLSLEHGHRTDLSSALGLAHAAIEHLSGLLLIAWPEYARFGRGELADIVAAAPVRVACVRLASYPGSARTVRAFLLPGCAKLPDFEEAIADLVSLSKNAKARLEVLANGDEFARAESLLETPANGQKPSVLGLGPWNKRRLAEENCLEFWLAPGGNGAQAILDMLTKKAGSDALAMFLPVPAIPEEKRLGGIASLTSRLRKGVLSLMEKISGRTMP